MRYVSEAPLIQVRLSTAGFTLGSSAQTLRRAALPLCASAHYIAANNGRRDVVLAVQVSIHGVESDPEQARPAVFLHVNVSADFVALDKVSLCIVLHVEVSTNGAQNEGRGTDVVFHCEVADDDYPSRTEETSVDAAFYIYVASNSCRHAPPKSRIKPIKQEDAVSLFRRYIPLYRRHNSCQVSASPYLDVSIYCGERKRTCVSRPNDDVVDCTRQNSVAGYIVGVYRASPNKTQTSRSDQCG